MPPAPPTFPEASNMNMHRTRFLAAIAGLLLLGLGGTAAAQSTVRCESSDN